jgi:hypothetical protein
MSMFLLQRPKATMYLLVYVDDIILISSSDDAAGCLVSALSGDFVVKVLGALHYFLGLEVSVFCWVDSHSAQVFSGLAALCWYIEVQIC